MDKSASKRPRETEDRMEEASAEEQEHPNREEGTIAKASASPANDVIKGEAETVRPTVADPTARQVPAEDTAADIAGPKPDDDLPDQKDTQVKSPGIDNIKASASKEMGYTVTGDIIMDLKTKEKYDLTTDEGKQKATALYIAGISNIEDAGNEKRTKEGEGWKAEDEIYKGLNGDSKEIYAYAKDLMLENNIDGPIMQFALTFIALAGKIKGLANAFMPGYYMEEIKEEMKDEKFSPAELERMKKGEIDINPVLSEEKDVAKLSTEYVSKALKLTESIDDPKSLAAKLMHSKTLGKDGNEHSPYGCYESADGFSKLLKAKAIPKGTVIFFAHGESKEVVPAIAVDNNKTFVFYNPERNPFILKSGNNEIKNGLMFHAAFVPQLESMDTEYFASGSEESPLDFNFVDYVDPNPSTPGEENPDQATEKEKEKTPDVELKEATEAANVAAAAFDTAIKAAEEAKAEDKTKAEESIETARKAAESAQEKLRLSMAKAEKERPLTEAAAEAHIKATEAAAKEALEKLTASLTPKQDAPETDATVTGEPGGTLPEAPGEGGSQ